MRFLCRLGRWGTDSRHALLPKAHRHRVSCRLRANDCALKRGHCCVGQCHGRGKHLRLRRALESTTSSGRMQESSPRLMQPPCPAPALRTQGVAQGAECPLTRRAE